MAKNRTQTSRRLSYDTCHPEELFISPLVENALLDFFDSQCFKGKDVLDVGCGSQPFKNNLISAGANYYSLDVAEIDGVTIDYIQQLDTDFHIEKKFDFIICTEVLEHVVDWNTAFNDLNKLLRDNGEIVITCPHFYQLHEKPHDYWRPTPFTFDHYARKYNLTVQKNEQLGSFWDVVGTVVNTSYGITRKQYNYRTLLVQKVLVKLLKLSSKALGSRYLHTNFEVSSPLYMTNFVLLRK